MCYGALITGAVQTFSLSDPRRKTELKVNHSEHYLSVTHAPFSQQIHLPLISAELGESVLVGAQHAGRYTQSRGVLIGARSSITAAVSEVE